MVSDTESTTESPRMIRAEELPFEVPDWLAEEINEYIDALERDDWQLDMYMEILHQSSGVLHEYDRAWLLEYYTNSGWVRGMEYVDYA